MMNDYWTTETFFKRMIEVLIFGTVLIGCETPTVPSSDNSANHCDTVYIASKTIDPLAQTFELTFDLKEYTYGNYTDSILSEWVDQLPQSVRDSLIYGHLVVSKHIYLSGILFNYGDKVERARKYNHKIERYLYPTIGMSQGLPSAVFSTRFHASESEGYGERDFMRLRVGRLYDREE